MKRLTVYADPDTPDQRVYQLDDGTAGEAFIDMLDAFRGAAFRHDLGVEAPGAQPTHNIPAQLQAISGVGTVAFNSPNYVVFRRPDANWDAIDGQVRRVFAEAFGEIEQLSVIDGPLA